MGALTLKSFPFELRGWDIEKFESLDPTDGFGSNTRVYINKNQIIQIEPDFNIYTFNSWLTDKGRQFFDSLFESQTDNSTKNVSFWYEMFNAIIKTTYIFDHCNKQVNKNHFFTIVFDHLSIETVSMLMLINNSYPFLKLRYSESLKINNNFESNLKLNNVSNRAKLNSSSLCLLISTNPRS